MTTDELLGWLRKEISYGYGDLRLTEHHPHHDRRLAAEQHGAVKALRRVQEHIVNNTTIREGEHHV